MTVFDEWSEKHADSVLKRLKVYACCTVCRWSYNKHLWSVLLFLFIGRSFFKLVDNSFIWCWFECPFKEIKNESCIVLKDKALYCSSRFASH